MQELNEVEINEVSGGVYMGYLKMGAAFILIGACGVATGGFGAVVAGSVLMAGGGWLASQQRLN